MFKHFVSSFFAKSVASFDDAITRIPVIADVTKTRMGKVAFSIGNILAVGVAIAIAFSVSKVIADFKYARQLTASLIFLLALSVQFDLFSSKKQKPIKERIRIRKISRQRFLELIGIGFVVSFVTLIDDSIVLTPLFLGDLQSHIVAILGIYASTLFQIVLIIFFAERLSKFKYTKTTAVFGLLALSFVVWFQIL